MDGSEEDDSITKISLRDDTIYGKKQAFPEIDKMCGVIVRIRDKQVTNESKNRLIAMLEDLLSKEEKEKKETEINGKI